MTLDLDSVVRVNGAACNHFNVTYNVEGVARPVFRVDKQRAESFLEGLTADLPTGATYKDLLMMLMIRYYLGKGYTLTQLPAKCQLPD